MGIVIQTVEAGPTQRVDSTYLAMREDASRPAMSDQAS
jgi:hypothetical protein